MRMLPLAMLREHSLVLAFYALLSMVLSWPLINGFTTQIAGHGLDPLHNLWMFWHTKQVVYGQQPLFEAPFLYYPHGISLWVHGLGPVTGLFALPFWFWGPEAAHNGAVLVSLCLTGYCMYLLARSLGFDRGVAFFAGVMLVSAPMCIAGVLGHMTKVFLGGLPLVLLTLLRALDPRRNLWWTLAVAVVLQIPLHHSGYQFVFAGFTVGFFMITYLIIAEPAERIRVLKRSLLTGLGMLVLIGPFIINILLTSRELGIRVKSPGLQNQPDLVQFFVPSFLNRLFGPMTESLLAGYEIVPNIEQTVTLSVTGIMLCVVAWVWGGKKARIWVLFTLVCVLFALGSYLKVLGETNFTRNDLPIILPYAFFVSLPGMGFLGNPGRFMMIGFVGFGIAASFGLTQIMQRWSRWRYAILVCATLLILMENWPIPFPQQSLPAVPDFYQHIANDSEMYGVFDIPITPSPYHWPISYSAVYQTYQMTHQKGIFLGYLSRTYAVPPVLSHFYYGFGQFGQMGATQPDAMQPDMLVNGKPVRWRENMQASLANFNYRYVVWHKTGYYQSGNEWGQSAAQDFINAVFGQDKPLVDDDQVRVYRVQPYTDTSSLTTTLSLGSGWYNYNPNGWRWATSPAFIHVVSPHEQPVVLEITPTFIYDPQRKEAPHRGEKGVLIVQMDDEILTKVEITAGYTAEIPLVLPSGSRKITFMLEAGNFQPPQDSRQLSFAIKSINLRVLDKNDVLPADIKIDGEEQQHGLDNMVALYGSGWYPLEKVNEEQEWRWGSSPSNLFVYSPVDQSVKLVITPTFLYMPEQHQALGDQGELLITTNHGQVQQLPVFVGRSSVSDILLQAGWNQVTLALETGNFRPAEISPGSSDSRLLSFALRNIDLRVK